MSLSVQTNVAAMGAHRNLVGTFDFISPETAEKMPTSPEHLRVSHFPDAAWLAPRLPAIRERFSQWLAS